MGQLLSLPVNINATAEAAVQANEPEKSRKGQRIAVESGEPNCQRQLSAVGMITLFTLCFALLPSVWQFRIKNET